jgi:hypothetical protein
VTWEDARTVAVMPKYGTDFRALRRAYKPLVEAGRCFCTEPACLEDDRWIRPGTDWHLSHPVTGTKIIGPSHARCNTTEGSHRGNIVRWGSRTTGPWRTTRAW